MFHVAILRGLEVSGVWFVIWGEVFLFSSLIIGYCLGLQTGRRRDGGFGGGCWLGREGRCSYKMVVVVVVGCGGVCLQVGRPVWREGVLVWLPASVGG